MNAQKCNFNTHTNFCDGKNTAEEMVIAAINAGINVLGFSGHCIHPLNPEFYKPVDDIWHMPSDKIQDYVNEVLRTDLRAFRKLHHQLADSAGANVLFTAKANRFLVEIKRVFHI